MRFITLILIYAIATFSLITQQFFDESTVCQEYGNTCTEPDTQFRDDEVAEPDDNDWFLFTIPDLIPDPVLLNEEDIESV